MFSFLVFLLSLLANLTVAYNEYLTVLTVLNRFRNDCSFNFSLVFPDFPVVLLLGFSSSSSFFLLFFLQRGSLLPAKCVVFQVHATHPRGVPDNNPQRESLMNRVTIRGKSINVCIAVLKNAAVVCRGIYLINGSFNPRKESLLLPSLGSI